MPGDSGEDCSGGAVAPCGGFPAGGAAGAGGISGAGKKPSHRGTGSGAFGIKGLAARIYFSFTLSSPFTPAVAPAGPPTARMARTLRGRKGAGERCAGHAGPVGQSARP